MGTPQKLLLPYEKVFAKNTEFFSSCNPDTIEEALVEHLRKISIEPKINNEKYKIKYSYVQTNQDETKETIEVCVRILKVGDDQVCVEFTKLSGPNVLFHENFNELTKKTLNFANDSIVAES